MQLASRFFLSALIGATAAMFAAAIVGSILPRFAYSLQVSYGVVGVVFTLASGYAAPKTHRRLIAIVLLLVGSASLAFLDFRGEPLSFLVGACLAYAFLWFTPRP